jgi:hypothetical protein
MALSKAQLDAFERFRAAYPRRPDNPWARTKKRFEEALKRGVSAEDLIRSAEGYAEQCRIMGKEPKFISYASTFLHQRDYEDFLEEAPASAEPHQPNPEHPLAWLRPEIGDAAFLSWIEPLRVDEAASPVCITAPTKFALATVQRDHGAALLAHYGDLAWGLQPKSRP